MVGQVTTQIQLMEGTPGVLKLLSPATLDIDCLDQANHTAPALEDGALVERTNVMVCKFIQCSLTLQKIICQ